MSFIIELVVEEVVVLQSKSHMDRIHIKFDGAAPLLAWPDEKPSLKMDVVRGTGAQYVRDNFNCEPKVIEIE
jgi:hypothetical protein